jgi:hypothetical protein
MSVPLPVSFSAEDLAAYAKANPVMVAVLGFFGVCI